MIAPASRNYYKPSSSGYGGGGPMSSMEPSRMTTDSRDEPAVSVSNASEVDSEWIEEDEPGVYITIRQLADGTRELRRVRFRYFTPLTLLSPRNMRHHKIIFKLKLPSNCVCFY